MRWILAALVLLIALPAVAEQRLLVDGDIPGYPTVTEDWTTYWSHSEGLYAVNYHAKIVAADSLELLCVNGASVTNPLVHCRMMFSDTLPTLTTTLPIEVLLYRSSTYDSAGTGLTEWRLDQSASGTITSAWYVNPVDHNGTLAAAFYVNSGEWFELPEDLELTGTYIIMAVLSQKTYFSFEAIWAEDE
jgi:hypothetical protein